MRFEDLRKEKPSQSLYLQGFEDYRPQQFLYFFSEPHARPLTIFCLYMVQIVLCVFPLFYGHLVHYIISIIYIINITNFICYVDKMWTRIIFSQHFVSSFIISQNKILENKSTSLYKYVIFLWYHIYEVNKYGQRK